MLQYQNQTFSPTKHTLFISKYFLWSVKLRRKSGSDYGGNESNHVSSTCFDVHRRAAWVPTPAAARPSWHVSRTCCVSLCDHLFLLPIVLLPGSFLLYHIPASSSPIPFNSMGSSIRKLPSLLSHFFSSLFWFFRTSVLVISTQFQKSGFCGLTPVCLSQTKYMVFFFGKDCILHFAEQFKNCDCWRVCQTMHSMIFFSLVWWTRATTLMGQ